MKKHDFENQLRNFLRQEPFQPFTIMVNDGRTIFVDQPSIAFGGGQAGFIGPDEVVEFFDWQNVIGFRPASHEAAP